MRTFVEALQVGEAGQAPLMACPASVLIADPELADGVGLLVDLAVHAARDAA